MLYVDVPTLPELKALISVREDACLSIYVSTTPHTQKAGASRIAYGNLVRSGIEQLEMAGFDKRKRALLEDELNALRDDDEFWRFQANSLAVLAKPDRIQTFRLATAVIDTVQVSDRFYLKPLLRAIAFPQTALVLALSENSVRLIEIFADLAPSEVRVPQLPESAADAVRRASVNNLTQNTRIANAEGQTVLLRQYARKVDAALRAVLAGRDTPLILAATEPLGPIFRTVNSSASLLEEEISISPDRLSGLELAEAARAVLDQHYKEMIADARRLYETRSGERRATTSVDEAASAATRGAVEVLLVDIDKTVPGTVSDTDGAVTRAAVVDTHSYDILDEIAGRAISTGARLLAVRKEDIPEGAPLAAILRYPI